MLSQPFLKRLKRQKHLIISIIYIHILILLLLGIILLMGKLKNPGSKSFGLFFSSPTTSAGSSQPVERKARVLPPPENPNTESP